MLGIPVYQCQLKTTEISIPVNPLSSTANQEPQITPNRIKRRRLASTQERSTVPQKFSPPNNKHTITIGTNTYVFTDKFNPQDEHLASQSFKNIFPTYKEKNSDRLCYVTKNGINYLPKKN